MSYKPEKEVKDGLAVLQISPVFKLYVILLVFYEFGCKH